MIEIVERLAVEYAASRVIYGELAESIVRVVKDLAKDGSVDLFHTESRAKDIESFKRKLERPEKAGKYKKLKDVTDLCGVRFVVLYQKDVDAICKIIEDNFIIDRANSIDKNSASDPDKFGYLSVHLIVSHIENRVRLPDFRKYEGMKAEIQVRTVLQHAWAVIDRQLRYKNDSDIPLPVKRKLYRVSALLEGADEDLSEVEKSVGNLRRSYAAGVSEGQLAVAINMESLDVYIQNSRDVERIEQAARLAGIVVEVRDRYDPKDEIKYNRLLSLIKSAGISNIDELNNVLNNLIEKPDYILRKFLHNANNKPIKLSIYALIRVLLYFSSDKKVRSIAKRSGGYVGSTLKAINATLGSIDIG
ncbi:hypothetical protein ASD64_05510 [Mesorhizobium sp. Root157]|uniref:GTP pyrophosphokinase n=1 Tax=Mesorhizobium sp. Root157 TaxID=1736477 RepID=UPI0006F73692|nr:hypothetical protein [Mesorhizobium sp. Root157]KQZ94313.1 hypothetical protein ASD64_05510 [Mesorhizobium sp. Root157]